MEVYPKITPTEWDLLRDTEGTSAASECNRIQEYLNDVAVVASAEANAGVLVGPFFALRAAIDAAEKGDCSYSEHLSKVSDSALAALRSKIQKIYVTRRAELLDQQEKGSK